MTKKHARKSKSTFQPAILIGVVMVVGLILILKAQQSSTKTAVPVVPTTGGSGIAAVQVAAPTHDVAQPTPTPVSNPAQPDVDPATPAAIDLNGLSPEEQVDHLLAAGQPVFAFFHSNTCQQCIDMTGIVNQVYPDFIGQVYLVDVNVYDQQNQNLLRRANLRVIPTLIFVDRSGQSWGYTGVMPADALREQLNTLAGGE